MRAWLVVRVISLWLIAAALPSIAAADEAAIQAELDRAQEALSAERYADAYDQYSTIAETDEAPLAFFSLALFHQFGWGMEVDEAEACRWFERAAVGDVPTAAHFFAVCLRDGLGRAADPAAAAQWFGTAIELGHYASLCDLGILQIEGRGVAKMTSQGIDLCAQAAQMGVPGAQLQLAELFDGHDEVRDPIQARFWYEQSAAHSAQAQFRLGVMARDGIGGPQDLELAKYWLESAAAQGYLDAYYPTAVLFNDEATDPETGELLEFPAAKAYMWLTATAHRLGGNDQGREAAALRAELLESMPADWQGTLDEKVDAHLAQFDAP